MGCSALGRHVCHIPSSKGSGIITGKGTESVRASGWVTIQEQCLLDTAGQLYMRTHSSCASMHKTLVSSSQTKPQQKERRRSWSPPWSERSTTIGNCRGRECQFSLGTLLQPYRELHIQQYLGSTYWTWWLLQKKGRGLKAWWVWKDSVLGAVGVGVKMSQTHSTEFSKR